MFLFVEDAVETGLGTDPSGDAFGYNKVVAAFKTALKESVDASRYQSFFIKLEDQAIKTSRTLAGSIAGYSDALQQQMFSVYKETIKIGGSTKDVIDYAESFASATGKVPAIQEKIVVSAIKISKEFGISTKEVAAMAGEFSRIGLGQQQAVDAIRNIGNTARKYGVNAQTLTKTVQENVKKANAFTFKDGIKGLTEMAAKAQKLGISMDSAFSTYEAFLDPDKAIEMGTEISMLGGSFAKAFGDPLKNMSMSVEEVQESFIKAAQDAAVFNAETGQFEIPKEKQKAILSFASKMNIDMKEFSSLALQAQKNKKVLADSKFQAGISEDDKEFVASMSEFNQKSGKWEIQLPGMKQPTSVESLTSADIEKFKTASETKELTMEQTNEKLLSSAEKQNVTLIQIRDALVLKGTLTTGKSTVGSLNDIAALSSDVISKIAAEFPVTQLVSVITAVENNTKTYVTSNTGLKNTIDVAITALNRSVDAVKDTGKAEDAFFPAGGAPVVMSEGEIYEGIVGDQVMMGTNLSDAFEMPREQMRKSKVLAESLLKNYEDPFKNMASGTLQNNIQSPAPKLQELITTTNSNINITGGANVSGSVDVKVTGSGLNLDDSKLSAMISSKVSAAIEERLSKRWGEKQGNIKTV